jgi:Na+/H+ antiporter NhaD/arsenite permease-like protein
MFGFFVATAFASALLDNVTTVLLMMPVTLTIARHLQLDPRPFLVTQVIASNIGGTATLIGDPPNIVIGSATGLTFLEFIGNLAPIVLLLLAIVSVAFWFGYGRRMPQTGGLAALADLDERAGITNPGLLRTSLVVLGLTLVGFLLHGALHLQPATIALAGATTLVLVGRISIQQVVEEVEWGTILFFVGLFILVGALESVGVLEAAGRLVVHLTGGNLAVAAIAILWFAAFASSLVDNIPAVASLVPVLFAVARLVHPGVPDEALVRLPDVYPLWWSLALGACLGGNATLIGASANVVVADASSRQGFALSFWDFTRIGLPITLLSLAVSTVYVFTRYLA